MNGRFGNRLRRSFVVLTLLGGIWSALIPGGGTAQASTVDLQLYRLDFDNNGTAADIVPGNAQIRIESKDMAQETKTNGTSASASGSFARLSAASGENVSASAELSGDAKNEIVRQLNRLAPGHWELKIEFDFDMVSNGNDSQPRPSLLFRIYGQSAVVGETGTKELRIVNVQNIGGMDTRGDDSFSHYTATLPIDVYAAVDAADNGNGLFDQFLAGSFTSSQVQVTMRSLPEAAVPMTVDIDNIRIGASSEDANRPTDLVFDQPTRIRVGETAELSVHLQGLTDSGDQPLAGRSVEFAVYAPSSTEQVLGSVLTDVYGLAAIDFTPPDIGVYTIEARYAADVSEQEAAASATADLIVASAWTTAPALLRVSDAVSPGKLMTIYGDGFDGASGVMLSAPDHLDELFPPSGAIEAQIVQIDPEGNYVVARMPASAAAGTYGIWVSNGYGWSRPILLNAARPQWISENIAAAGLTVTVVGRNLDGSEFGSRKHTAVKLVSGAESYPANVIRVNPFAVEFRLPPPSKLPLGEYEVWVANDGIHYRPLEEEQTLTVVAKGDDPLGLSVAWAYDFAWDNEFDVTDYGADGADVLDDTSAIQGAIDAASAADGGVVYFPAGNYRISQLELPADVVLLGRNRASTYLTYVPPAAATVVELENWTVIRSTSEEGSQGLARLTLTMDSDADDKPLPNQFLWLGNSWNPDYSTDQTAEKLFLKDFALDYRYERGPWSKSGVPGYIGIEAKGHVLIADSVFKGFAPNPTSSYMREYVQVLNNTFDTTAGNVYLTSRYVTVRGNDVHRSDPSVDYAKQGIFTRGPSYVADNHIVNTGSLSANDGEIVSVENYRGGLKMLGIVESAGTDTVTLVPKRDENGVILGGSGNNDWSLERRPWGDWHIVIVEGRGMGQYRQLDEYLGDATYSVTVPWDIVPDASSKFAIVLPNKMVTTYRNLGENNGNTFQLYGDTIDAVLAGNISIDGEGFYAHSIYLERPEQNDSRFAVAYYTRVEDNVVQGVSWRSNVGTITFMALNETDDPFAYQIYGADIKGNEIDGIHDSSRLMNRNYYNGIAVGSLHNAVKPTRNAVKNIIIEDNDIRNTDRGITIGAPGPQMESNASYLSTKHASAIGGTVLSGNAFSGVDREVVNDYGSDVLIDP
ncbi:glycosyl hydrolase family 28-related protein [Cohnella fermenti]|nr:glycosyl hydrolase family 28-related protein [Cohnella fermenti]